MHINMSSRDLNGYSHLLPNQSSLSFNFDGNFFRDLINQKSCKLINMH